MTGEPRRPTITRRPFPASRGGDQSRGAPRKKGFNWASFLIESAIAIVVFNVIAALAAWYFILPRLKH